MTSTYQEILENAGFEPSVSAVYIYLIENGEHGVDAIAKSTNLSRAGVYDALNMLVVKDFVEYRKQGRNAYYKPVHPNKLFGLIEEKKRDFNALETELKTVIQGLTGAFNLSVHKPGVRFFEGQNALREILDDSLSAEGEIYTFIDSEAINKHFKEENARHIEQRRKKNLYKKIIALDCDYARKHYQNLHSEITKIKLLPPSQRTPFRTSVQIYNNSVSFFTLTEQAQMGVLVQDENIANFLKTIFEFAWNSLPELIKQPSSNNQSHQNPDSNQEGPLVVLKKD
jgi:sugar-specific transcriptional regulator TrmB